MGPSDELGSGTEIQLPQDVVDVCLHRPGRDVEPGGDLAVGHSSGDQLGNLRFATGQPLPRWPPVAWPIVQPRRQRLVQGQLSSVGEQPCGGGARRGAGLSQPLGQAALQRLRCGDLVDLPYASANPASRNATPGLPELAASPDSPSRPTRMLKRSPISTRAGSAAPNAVRAPATSVVGCRSASSMAVRMPDECRSD